MHKSLVVCVMFLLAFNFASADDKSVDLNIQYKKSVTLKCDLEGDIQFYYTFKGKEQQLNSVDGLYEVSKENKTVEIKKPMRDEIEAEYYCKQEGDSDNKIIFKKQVLPFLYKPEKTSVTETEGGSVEFQCQLLFPENDKVDFIWYKNVTGELNPLKESSTIEITSGEEVVNNKTVKFTKLRISNVQEADRGEYVCEAKNEFGSHSEQFMLRVKNTLAALWPFLAIVAEVLILCVIILIYEKKCNKKPQATEEETEQSQNLMGKEVPSDLKKRNNK